VKSFVQSGKDGLGVFGLSKGGPSPTSTCQVSFSPPPLDTANLQLQSFADILKIRRIDEAGYF